MDVDTLTKALTAKNAAFGVIALAILYVATSPSRPKSKAPLLNYRLPLIGSTPDYARNPAGFAKEMTDKYDSAFRMHFKGEIHTVVSSSELIRKVFVADDQLNFIAAVSDSFNPDVLFGFPPDRDAGLILKVVSKHLTPKLANYVPRIEKQLRKGFDPILNDPKDSKTINNVFWYLSETVARSSSSVFVGTELCENDELVNSFQTLTIDAGVILSPKGIFKYLPHVWSQWNTLYYKLFPPRLRHVEVVNRIVMPVVEQRRREQAKLGGDWERPEDLLQWMVEEISPDPSGPLDKKLLTAYIFALIFASIHTSSTFTTIVIMQLAAHPEYLAPLREELNEVLSDPSLADEEGGMFSMPILKRLVKMDSFIREAFRLNDETLVLAHKNISGEILDLGDGITVNPGEKVLINVMEERLRPEVQGPNPEVFDGMRFVGKGKSATKVGPDMMLFGMGKHACPGRFLAVTAMKMILSLLIKDHDISFAPVEGGIILTRVK